MKQHTLLYCIWICPKSLWVFFWLRTPTLLIRSHTITHMCKRALTPLLHYSFIPFPLVLPYAFVFSFIWHIIFQSYIFHIKIQIAQPSRTIHLMVVSCTKTLKYLIALDSHHLIRVLLAHIMGLLISAWCICKWLGGHRWPDVTRTGLERVISTGYGRWTLIRSLSVCCLGTLVM